MSDLFQRLTARAKGRLGVVKPVLGPRFGPAPLLPEDGLAGLDEALSAPSSTGAAAPGALPGSRASLPVEPDGAGDDDGVARVPAPGPEREPP